MKLPETFDLVFLQTMGGGTEVLERGIPARDALRRLHAEQIQNLGAGGVAFLRPSNDVLAAVQQEMAVLEATTSPTLDATYPLLSTLLDTLREKLRKPSAERDGVALRRTLLHLAARSALAVEELEQ